MDSPGLNTITCNHTWWYLQEQMEVLESCGGFPAASVTETPATVSVDGRLSALTVHMVSSKCTSDQQKHHTGKDISSYCFLTQPQRPASDKTDCYHKADRFIHMKHLESTMERKEPSQNRVRTAEDTQMSVSLYTSGIEENIFIKIHWPKVV